MKYEDAKNSLQHALDNQQTISINRLKKLIHGMEISNRNEVERLKERLKKNEKRLINQRREIARMERYTKKLKEGCKCGKS